MAGARGKPLPSHSSLPGVFGQHTTSVEQATTKMTRDRNPTRIEQMSTLMNAKDIIAVDHGNQVSTPIFISIPE